jgi:hypothetical protein
MAKLVLSCGGTVVNQYFVDKIRLTIGRDSHNDVVIDDAAISREHAAIITVGNDQIVEDLHSSNGIYVNGALVARQILHHRDVIEFGPYSLAYLNSKAAADIDFDRTMIIAALPRQDDKAGIADCAIPAARQAGTRWPSGRVKHLSGPDSGKLVELGRVVTLFGTPGAQTAVITRRPHGYFITHVEGRDRPQVNRKSIGSDSQLLRNGDIVTVAGQQLEFQLET